MTQTNKYMPITPEQIQSIRQKAGLDQHSTDQNLQRDSQQFANSYLGTTYSSTPQSNPSGIPSPAQAQPERFLNPVGAVADVGKNMLESAGNRFGAAADFTKQVSANKNIPEVGAMMGSGAEGAAQTAGFMADVGEGAVGSAAKFALGSQAVDAITGALGDTGKEIFSGPTGQKVLHALGQGMDHYEQFKKDNPGSKPFFDVIEQGSRLALDIGTLGGASAIGGAIKEGVAGAVKGVGERGIKGAVAQGAKYLGKTESSVLDKLSLSAEEMSASQKEKAFKSGLQIDKPGPLGTSEISYSPSKTTLRTSEIMKGEITAADNPSTTYAKINTQISRLGARAEEYLGAQNKSIGLSRSQLPKYIQAQESILEAKTVMQPSEAKAFDQQLKGFTEILKKQPDDSVLSYYKAIKQYRKLFRDKIPFFDQSGLLSIRRQAVKDVSNIIDELIVKQVPDFTDLKFDLRSLYDTADDVVQKGINRKSKGYVEAISESPAGKTAIGITRAVVGKHAATFIGL